MLILFLLQEHVLCHDCYFDILPNNEITNYACVRVAWHTFLADKWNKSSVKVSAKISFSLCMTDFIFKHISKNTQKSAKAYQRFFRILLQLCRSRFRFIISEWKFRCKSQGTGVEKELFWKQSGIQRKMEECKSLHLNV